MATIAEIAVNVTARTQKLEKDLARAKGKLNKFGNQAKSAGGGLKALALKAAGAAAAFLAVGKAVSGITSAMSEIDEASKKARVLGMTTQQVLQLRHSAQLAGVSTGNFSKSIEKMAVNVSRAAQIGGAAADVLGGMGINLQELSKQTPHQMFMTLTDAIKNIESPTEKARVAYELFGRQGIELITMMEGGSAALRTQAADFDKLHGKISDTDAKAVEDANDAILEMKQAFKGVFVQLTTLLAPAFEVLAGIIQGVAKFMRNVVDALKSMGVNMKVAVPVIMAIVAALLIYKLGLIEATMAKIALLAMSGPAGWAQLAAGGLVLAAGMGAFSKHVKDADESVAGMGRTQQENIGTMEEHTAAVDDAAKAQEDLAKAGAQVTEQFKNPMEKFQDRMLHLDQLVRAGAITWETYSRAVQGAIADQKKANQRKIEAASPISAVTMGSSAGFSAIQKANREQEKQTKIAEQELAQAKETNRILNGVRDDIQNEPEPQVANI